MQTKNLESGRVMVVANPDDATNFTVIESHSYFHSPRLEHSIGGIDLPPGQWQLLGIGSEIKEEVCSGVIPELNCRERYPNYCGDYPIWFHSRIESLHSLLRSMGFEPDKAIVLFESKK